MCIHDYGVRAFCQGCNNKILPVTAGDSSWNLYIFSLPPKFKHRMPHRNIFLFKFQFLTQKIKIFSVSLLTIRLFRRPNMNRKEINSYFKCVLLINTNLLCVFLKCVHLFHFDLFLESFKTSYFFAFSQVILLLLLLFVTEKV